MIAIQFHAPSVLVMIDLLNISLLFHYECLLLLTWACFNLTSFALVFNRQSIGLYLHGFIYLEFNYHIWWDKWLHDLICSCLIVSLEFVRREHKCYLSVSYCKAMKVRMLWILHQLWYDSWLNTQRPEKAGVLKWHDKLQAAWSEFYISFNAPPGWLVWFHTST